MRTLILEGILSIQAGDNPRVVAEKLMSLRAARRARCRPRRRQAEPAARRRSPPTPPRRPRSHGPHSGRRRRAATRRREENEERWLLTYADMITLLMALFMVLFSISSVNTSKFVALQQSLQDAFSGRILPGGASMQESGGSTTIAEGARPRRRPPRRRHRRRRGRQGRSRRQAPPRPRPAKAEEKDFKALKARVDAYVAKHGLPGKVTTIVTQRRPRHPPAHRQAALRQRVGRRCSPAGAACSTKVGALLRAENQHVDPRARVTPTPSRSTRPRSRPTGSCRPAAPRPSSAPSRRPASRRSASRPPGAPHSIPCPAMRPPPAARATAASRSCCPAWPPEQPPRRPRRPPAAPAVRTRLRPEGLK